MDSEVPAIPPGEEILKGSDISLSVSEPLNATLCEILIIPFHPAFHVTLSHQNSQGLVVCAAVGEIMEIGEGYNRGLKVSISSFYLFIINLLFILDTLTPTTP